MCFQDLQAPACEDENRRGSPRDEEMKCRAEGSRSEAALEGRSRVTVYRLLSRPGLEY